MSAFTRWPACRRPGRSATSRVGAVDLVLGDPVPLHEERIPVFGRLLAHVLVLQEQGVELFGLDHQIFSVFRPPVTTPGALGPSYLSRKGRRLLVPAVLQGVIDQIAGVGPGFGSSWPRASAASTIRKPASTSWPKESRLRVGCQSVEKNWIR